GEQGGGSEEHYCSKQQERGYNRYGSTAEKMLAREYLPEWNCRSQRTQACVGRATKCNSSTSDAKRALTIDEGKMRNAAAGEASIICTQNGRTEAAPTA